MIDSKHSSINAHQLHGKLSELSSEDNNRDGGLRPRLVAHQISQLRDGSPDSAISSGRSTPLPPDALPSQKSIHHAKKERRKRIFPTIDYEERMSHITRESGNDFRGFFNLFWIGLCIMVITTGARNMKESGRIFRTDSVFRHFTNDIHILALADLLMVATTSASLLIHRILRANVLGIRWSNGGYLLQWLYQLVWGTFWIYYPWIRDWQWTHQVFFTLHTLTLLMKMHSFAFYCGYLSEVERKLKELDKNTLSTESKDDTALREVLAWEVTSPLGRLQYPRNLSFTNYVDYLLCPTLCYELEYPRIKGGIRWTAVAEKAAAVFGCVFLLTIISEEFIAPVMKEGAIKLQNAVSTSEMLLVLGESISLLLFPFMLTFLLVFLVIFEYTLGAFAEITCFADRGFYADWWNSTNWLEFSRKWNIPVHNFLKRHVYAQATILSRSQAMVLTFLISSVFHELVLFCLTRKIRGYGALCQMMQVPIVALQTTPWMRDRKKSLQNVFFWSSMVLGLSLNCALYVLF